jgi:hypothetical protein
MDFHRGNPGEVGGSDGSPSSTSLQHISSVEVRHALLISGKRNKQHVVEEKLTATNEYLTPSQITKATLSKWIVECIA